MGILIRLTGSLQLEGRQILLSALSGCPPSGRWSLGLLRWKLISIVVSVISQYPVLMTIVTGKLSALLLCLCPLYHSSPIKGQHYCKWHTNLPADLEPCPTRTGETRPQNTWTPLLKVANFSQPEGGNPLFSGQRPTMASNLEVLTLIPTASHSAAIHPYCIQGYVFNKK